MLLKDNVLRFLEGLVSDVFRALHSKDLEEIHYIFALRAPSENLVEGDARTLGEGLPHHVRNIEVTHVFCDSVDLARRHEHALDTEFKIHEGERLYFVEVEQVEKDYILLVH